MSTPSAAGAASATNPTTIISKKSLLQQLPAGSVLAFQTLAASFTNQGNCLPSNWWLTVGLVTFLSATCIFFSFTDSVQDPKTGKVHKGVALPGRLHVLNLTKEEQKDLGDQLKKCHLKPTDWVHAFLSAVVFLTIAGSDVGLQNCFFPYATDDTRQLLRNLPLGMAVMTSFMFMIFPTTRKGISFDSTDSAVSPAPPPTPPTPAAAIKPVADHQEPDPEKQLPKAESATAPTDAADIAGTSSAGNNVEKAADKVLTTSSNLLQLLPTGAVLAFQTLSASFTNQGKCYHSNLALTIGLVTFLGATCIFSAFTDSVWDGSKYRKGVALPRCLYVFNMPREEQRKQSMRKKLWEKRLKTLDWVHAFFTLVVFLTVAGSDVGLQNCFFPKATDDTKQLLKNLPLGMAVLSSFIFTIFPTTRKSILFDDSEYSVLPPVSPQPPGPESKDADLSSIGLTAVSNTRPDP
ncbi:hypothetical protein EJB05_27383, partial [Eragrostis curvula]